MAVSDAMGVGGGGGVFGKKVQLVADLEAAFKSLNKELQKTVDLSDKISKNLKGAGGASAGSLLQLGPSTGTKDPSQNDGSQNNNDGSGTGGGGGGSRVTGILGALGRGTLAAGAMVMNAMPSVATAFETDSLRAQFGAMTGQGAGSTAMYKIANQSASQGLPTDSMDAMRASMTGASRGMLPSLSNYGQVMGSAAQISALVPGAGMQGGMQAMSALNQGRAVNMGRMMGINIRNAQGLMNSYDNIANQLWSVINRQKSGSSPISPQDIAMSLQPGNALDSMINQLGIQDPVARQAIVNSLLLKANPNNKGGKLDITSLEKLGFVTQAQESLAKKNLAGQKLNQDTAQPLLKGFEAANTAITNVTNAMDKLATSTGILGDAFRAMLKSKGFVDTLASSGNGTGAALLGAAGGVASHLFGGILKAGKSLLSGAEREGGSALDMIKSAGGKALDFAKGVGSKAWEFTKAAASKGWEGLKAAGRNVGSWFEEALPELEGYGLDAVEAASVIGEEGAGGIADLFSGGMGTVVATGASIATIAAINKLRNNIKKKKKPGHGGGDGRGSTRFGFGGQDDTVKKFTYGKPLAGSPPITSQFGVIRNIPGSPSFGKPHGGTDFGVPEGTPVYAVTDGTVDETSWDDTGFGNWIQISDADGYSALFGHLSQKVAKGGDKVKAGDLIGYSGNTGHSTGPHLHFEVRKGQQKVDPMAYLGGSASTPQPGDASNASQGSGDNTANAGGMNLSGLKLTSMNTSGLAIGGSGLVAAPIFAGKDRFSDVQGSGVNYGGVTVNINIPSDATKEQRTLVEAIKTAVVQSMEHEQIRKRAVSA